MSLRLKSKEGSKKASPPEPAPSYMDSKQFAAYLASLRDNRVNRPGGARPLPEPSVSTSRRDSDRISTSPVSLSAASNASHPYMTPDSGRPRSSLPSIGDSAVSRFSSISGRDYYPSKAAAAPLKPNEIVPSATYMERGQRWMEKEEAYSLRSAMDDMDLKDKQRGRPQSTTEGSQEEPKSDENEDDTRLYNAALDEAAELVWQHQHGVKPPEPGTPYRYKPHLRKDSYAHARTASIGRYGTDIQPSGLARNDRRSGSGSSSGSEGRPSLDSSRVSLDNQSQRASTDSAQAKQQQGSAPRRPASGGRRRSSMMRNISGEIERPFSGDQIWEEPESDASKAAAAAAEKTSKAPETAPEAEPVPLRLRLRNPLKQAQSGSSSASDGGSASPGAASPTKPLQRIEIYRNPPTQSRNPNYTSNIQRPAGPRAAHDSVPRKNGVEIRGDDIRQATSFRLGDRSAKLPTPSAVSDRPGRPIVSFDANWTPPEEAAADVKPEPPREPLREPTRYSIGVLPVEHKEAQQGAGYGQDPKAGQPELQQALPSVPSVSVTPNPPASMSPSPRPSTSSTPSIPSISIGTPDLGPLGPQIPVLAVTPDDSPTLPSIQISGESNIPDIPVIVTPDDDNAASSSSSPTKSKPSARPLPTPSKAAPHARHVRGGRSHWSPAPGAVATRATAMCHECGFPIEGRFVALHGAKERFHPQCFACYTCGTSLEALEISPEPDAFRSARLGRIARRAAGEILPEERGKTEVEDGDARLRFYCHLDWHELFAPRCKHCTTPILGEHIVALGEHWHYGHFFCAECGDPFEHGMTHIEKDGYAWCINCQTKRTERRAPKCKRCRKAVIGQYVQALGGEWHDECFRCATCGGGFDDGQVFPAGDRVLCKVCRMRELKA